MTDLTPMQQAITWRKAMGLPIATPNDDDIGDAGNNVFEEFNEWEDAVPIGGVDDIKEAADLVFTMYQYAAVLGFDLDEALRRIYESNMTKLDDDGKPIIVNGKVQKGPNYVPPNLEDLAVR